MFGIDSLMESFSLLNEKDTDGFPSAPEDDTKDSSEDATQDDMGKDADTSDDTSTDDPNSDKDTNTDTPDDTNNTTSEEPTDTDSDNMDDGMGSDDMGTGDADPSSDGSSTEESGEMGEEPQDDNSAKVKKNLLISDFITIYNDINLAIKSFKQMGVESDEEKELLEKAIYDLLEIRKCVYTYVQTSFTKDDYETNLYKLYYFKDVMGVADEILQKIKELRREN